MQMIECVALLVSKLPTIYDINVRYKYSNKKDYSLTLSLSPPVLFYQPR